MSAQHQAVNPCDYAAKPRHVNYTRQGDVKQQLGRANGYTPDATNLLGDRSRSLSLRSRSYSRLSGSGSRDRARAPAPGPSHLAVSSAYLSRMAFQPVYCLPVKCSYDHEKNGHWSSAPVGHRKTM